MATATARRTRPLATFRQELSDGAIVAFHTLAGGHWLHVDSSVDMRGVSLTDDELEELITLLQRLRAGRRSA